MHRSYFSKWEHSIPPILKWTFVTSVVIALFTHLYVFTNRLPTWDSMFHMYDAQAKYASGRFSLSISNGFSSYFDMPWVNGILSTFFLACVATLIVRWFHIETKIAATLVSAIVVTFPSVTSTFAYMFTADGYFFGMLVTFIALLFTRRWTYGFVAGGLLLAFALGTYQANISIVLSFVIVASVIDLLFTQRSTKVIVQSLIKFGCMAALGLILYFLTFKLSLRISHTAVTAYQGLDQVGQLPLAQIPERLREMKQLIKDFFFPSIFHYRTLNAMELFNIVIFCLIFVVTIGQIIRIQLWKQLGRLALLVLFAITLPFAYYIMLFVSPEAGYHTLMVFGLSTIYLYVVVILDYVLRRPATAKRKTFVYVTTPLIGVIAFNFALIANIAYLNMDLRFEKSMHLANRVLDRIEQLDDYEKITSFATVGRVDLRSKLSREYVPQQIPTLVGTVGDTFLNETTHYRSAFENYMGYMVPPTPEDELEAIVQSEQFQQMPIWPARESVQLFDTHVIVKFQHTGKE